MQNQKRLIGILVLVLLFTGCSLWKPQTEYPAIEAGLRMTQWQMDLQREYNEIYPFLTPDQQQYMKEEIAPLIDNAKYMIGAYNAAVLNDERPIYTETEIRMLLREVSFKLLSSKEKGE